MITNRSDKCHSYFVLNNTVVYEYCCDTSDDDACITWISTGTTSSANLKG
jgi:hypothetical protein